MSHTGRSTRDVPCPLCGAATNRSCETADGMPWADHAERVALAAAFNDPDGERARRRRQVRYDSPPDIPQVARERRLPREYVRGFRCSKCASGPQDLCVDESGQTRTQNHRERVAVARASLSNRSAGPGTVRLWVAGTCPGGPGPGGWAAARWVKDRELVLRGNAALTTEHRMTLTAVIEGLLALPRTSIHLTVYVQPGHVLTALSKGWPALWRERDWIKHDGTPVKNRDRWERVPAATEPREIRWQPFAPTGGSPQQERVIAIAAAQR